jgi:hypothetical protein
VNLDYDVQKYLTTCIKIKTKLQIQGVILTLKGGGSLKSPQA